MAEEQNAQPAQNRCKYVFQRSHRASGAVRGQQCTATSLPNEEYCSSHIINVRRKKAKRKLEDDAQNLDSLAERVES